MADAHQSQGAVLKMDDASGSPSVFVTVGAVVGFDGPSGAAQVIDKTDLASTFKEKLMGLPDEGNIKFDLHHASGDAGQLAALAARTARRRVQFRLDLPAGSQSPASNPAQSWYFYGYVLSFTAKGSVDALIAATMDVAIDGQITRV